MEGGKSKMRVALTVWENRISPVFDSARMLLIVDVKNGTLTGKRYVPFDAEFFVYKTTQLKELGLSVLICGAISQYFANRIEAYGIRIIPFVKGEMNQALDAYLKDSLFRSNFLMPGCGTRRRHSPRDKRGGRKV
jgi:predicted Fe-Mo cluster-binding NifX family protein